MPRTLTITDPSAVDAAAAALAGGGVVILPTETVYGLAALPAVPGATDRLFSLKDRPEAVPLAVLVHDIGQAEEVAVLSPMARRLAERFWPGPLTLVLPRRPEASSFALGGSDAMVGVRSPAHDIVRAIARRVGPIATTSANRHGRPTPATAAKAAAALAGEVDLVLDGGRRDGVPSTVVDCSGSAPVILRLGAIPGTDLEEPVEQRPSRVFDRVADRYDETRGGLVRGQRQADVLLPWIEGRRVLEIGVGTGLVAIGLVDGGVELVGVDLSIVMLRRAAERLGARVAQGDATALPVGSGLVDTVIAVWVLHVVGDPDAVLGEAARVLRPAGRLVVIEAGGSERPDHDIASTIGDLHDRLRGEPQFPAPDRWIPRAEARGFSLVEQGFTPTYDVEETPSAEADNLEQRVQSSLWDVADEVWAAEVEPVITALRALPDPDRPRVSRVRHRLLVLGLGGSPTA
ncbi:MAG: L-threonylcarbamoyladenylate synthase [Acidimicrobiales bacterium]